MATIKAVFVFELRVAWDVVDGLPDVDGEGACLIGLAVRIIQVV